MSVNQFGIGNIYSGRDTIINSTVTNAAFARDIDEAIKRINDIHELEQQQKEYLASIMNEAKAAKSENEKQTCNISFKSFLKGLGKVADKVISVLADLASIATFFGL